MSDTISIDSPIQQQKSRPRKGKKTQTSRKGDFLNKTARALQNIPRSVREDMIEQASQEEPAWSADTLVQAAPVQMLMFDTDLAVEEYVLLLAMATAQPRFIFHTAACAKVLRCTEKTAQKWLKKLREKGFIRREEIKANGHRSYYCHRLVTLDVRAVGKNFPLTKIHQDEFTSPNLPSGEEGPAAPDLSRPTPIQTSLAKACAKAAVQPVGTLQATVGDPHPDSRKFTAWRKTLKDGVLFEENAATAAERAARKEPAPTREPKEPEDREWRTGLISQDKAWAWLHEHPEGIALRDHFLDMSSTEHWSPSLARMLFRRWRDGVITLVKVISLQKLTRGNAVSDITLRTLITSFKEIYTRHYGQLQGDRHMMRLRVQEFVQGNQSQVDIDRGMARRVIDQLHENGQLDYTHVFDLSPAPRYALLFELADSGCFDLVARFQDERMSEVEDEMAKNLAVWQFMDRVCEAAPSLFRYDYISAQMLRNHEKMRLQQACLLLGTTFEAALEQA